MIAGSSGVRSAALRALMLAALAATGGACWASTAGEASTEEVARDAAGVWERFLAKAELTTVYDAYDVLDLVDYTLEKVDAGKCREHAAALAAAAKTAPVSIAIHHTAMLCAEAQLQSAAAESEFGAVAALSKLALSQASEVTDSKPIRVLRFEDALALLRISGLEHRYQYYDESRPARYFPLTVAVWDADAKVEKHFRFDFVDTAFRLDRKDPSSGFPVQRNYLANGFLEGQTKRNMVMAWDVRAFGEAAEVAEAKDKIAKLRPAAESGGVRSAMLWSIICVRRPYPGCGDGLVDALLPQAEQQYASPMVLLAFAYAEGIGVKRDAAAAAKLLDAADRRRSHAQAGVDYAELWRFAHDGPLPADIVKRVERAITLGNRNAETFLITQRIYDEAKPALSPAELSHLAEPDQNSTGAGYALLAQYYENRKQTEQRVPWLAKAADAGHAGSQSDYGWMLWKGEHAKLDRDAAKRWYEQAAQGGNAWGARFMAMESVKAKRWKDAEYWLLAAIYDNSVEAIIDLAELYEQEKPGLSGNAARAVEIYRSLADTEADARRQLSQMALEGRGMAKDAEQAKKWLLSDAEKDDADSQTLLAMAYLEGKFGKVDEAEGRRWMERAMKAKDENAFSAYGSWLYYTKNTGDSRLQALDIWNQGLETGSNLSANNLAWAYCTAPQADVADAAKGMRAAAKIGDIDDMEDHELDTVAACNAASGDYKAAARLQLLAIERVAARRKDADPAEPVDPVDNVDGYRRRLALYEAGKPYVEITRD